MQSIAKSDCSCDRPQAENSAMEIFSIEFLAALLSIVVIDLVLAGDNAIVIALAARNVPRHLQRRAILWGTAGAIVVRSAMTLVVVWLLKIPGLLLVGGALLVWIAYRLLLPEEASEGGAAHSASSFWGAMRTIIVADAVMGLDNVLAVAGAAHGSYLLVVLGLLISIPIVVWGSTLMLRFVERYPAIVYVGAGVLAWTAAKMITSEPVAKDSFAAYGFTIPLTYVVLVCGVLWAGFVRNHRRLESRISAHLAALAGASATGAQTHSNEGGKTMQRILVPVGSRNAEYALRQVVNEFLANPALEVHVLNVQAPFSRHIAQFASRKARDEFHREQAEKVLAPARELLARHGVPFSVHVRLGDRAKAIVDEARRLRCERIVMATARKNSITRMLEDSVTNKVLEQTTMPVEIVAGDDVSPLERWGLPAGLGAAIAILIAASD
jgi:YjbE family integral membrane protein